MNEEDVPSLAGRAALSTDIARNSWRPVDGVMILSLLAALQVLQRALAVSGDELPTTVLGQAVADFFPTVVTAGAVLLLAWRRGMRHRDLGFHRPTSWRPALYAWAAAVIVGPSYAVALGLVGWELPYVAGAVIAPSSAVLATTAVSVVGVAPIVEEIIFRGVVFRGARARWPLVPAMMLTGMLFAGFHLDGPHLIPLAAVGGLFSYAYERTGSLWSAIAAHAGLNAMWLIAVTVIAMVAH